MLRDELFCQCSDLNIREVSEVQIGLLIAHEAEIKSRIAALMACVRTYDSEAAYQSRGVSSRVQSKRRAYDAVATGSALH